MEFDKRWIVRDRYGNDIYLTYDEVSDTLTISFASGVPATGIELTDHILLRISKTERKAISIVLFEYSVLAQKTEIGIRSFPIAAGLSRLAREMQEIVFEILLQKPVCDFLHLSAYTLSLVETIPIISLQHIRVAMSEV
ncbi:MULTISPECIES: hypothetical protein [Kamptonema]|uniref:hypothetical protein n=1 Tax=Kamptonema TaxID=1501433 RepID=UPI0001DAC254|nr:MULTISPECIES: hypothetical protein [Kamptonema]CBN54834.1 conserved hypothetical protein [Kamptonema sp. PCC 6506]